MKRFKNIRAWYVAFMLAGAFAHPALPAFLFFAGAVYFRLQDNSQKSRIYFQDPSSFVRNKYSLLQFFFGGCVLAVFLWFYDWDKIWPDSVYTLAIILAALFSAPAWYARLRLFHSDMFQDIISCLFMLVTALLAFYGLAEMLEWFEGKIDRDIFVFLYSILTPFLIIHIFKDGSLISWLFFLSGIFTIIIHAGSGALFPVLLPIAITAYFYPWETSIDWQKNLYGLVAVFAVGLLAAMISGFSGFSLSYVSMAIPDFTAERIGLIIIYIVYLYALFRVTVFVSHREIMSDPFQIRSLAMATGVSSAVWIFLTPLNPIFLFFPFFFSILLYAVVDVQRKNSAISFDADFPVGVSIVMPCYNGAAFIEQSIQSVQDQTFKNWELLITDDGSKDNSYEIIKAQSLKDPRISVFRHECAQGAGPARNTALNAAKGRYIAFLDCDDIWKPEKLAKQIEAMKQSGAALSATHYDVIDDDGKIVGVVRPRDKVFTFGRLLKSNDIGCSFAMLDRAATGKNLYFPAYERAQDFILWCSILKKGFLCLCIHENLGQYRVHKNSRTKNKMQTAINRMSLLRKALNVPFITILYYAAFYVLYGLIKQKRSRSLVCAG